MYSIMQITLLKGCQIILQTSNCYHILKEILIQQKESMSTLRDSLYNSLLTLNFNRYWSRHNSCRKTLEHGKNCWVRSACAVQGSFDIKMDSMKSVTMVLRLCFCFWRILEVWIPLKPINLQHEQEKSLGCLGCWHG